jgi:hypothetical protein
MRTLLLLIPLALVGCKPDPIEACVEAEKRLEFFKCDGYAQKDGGKGCSEDTKKLLATVYEPGWRKKCMRAAAGKED